MTRYRSFRHHALQALASACLLAGTAAPAPGQDHAALRQRLQVHLDSLHAAGRFPGVTLGVSLRDGSTLALAAGYADTVRRAPMPTDARMLAGSVGKTLVAAVALQLVLRGGSTWTRRSPGISGTRPGSTACRTPAASSSAS